MCTPRNLKHFHNDHKWMKQTQERRDLQSSETHKIPGSTEGILRSAYAAKRKNYLQLNTALNEKESHPS